MLQPFVENSGPFDLLQLVGDDCVPLTEIPFATVRGGQIAISVRDNINDTKFSSILGLFCADVQIVGIIKGIESVLCQGYLRGYTGPMVYKFEDADNYETIQIRARNMLGGKPPYVRHDPAAETRTATERIMDSTTQIVFDPFTGGGSGTPSGGGSGMGTQTIVTPDYSATLSVGIQPRFNFPNGPDPSPYQGRMP